MNKQEIERAIKYWKEFKGETPELKKSHPDAGLDEQEECVDMAIFALTQQLNNGWIPCSERLPDKTDEYLCTVEWYGTSTKRLLISNGHEIERRIKLVHYLDSNKSFKECDEFCTYKVLAWKLQEPWKGDTQ